MEEEEQEVSGLLIPPGAVEGAKQSLAELSTEELYAGNLFFETFDTFRCQYQLFTCHIYRG